jgi:hypothetical protein
LFIFFITVVEQHIKFYEKKYSLSLLLAEMDTDTDYDPGRQAMDADSDPAKL